VGSAGGGRGPLRQEPRGHADQADPRQMGLEDPDLDREADPGQAQDLHDRHPHREPAGGTLDSDQLAGPQHVEQLHGLRQAVLQRHSDPVRLGYDRGVQFGGASDQAPLHHHDPAVEAGRDEGPPAEAAAGDRTSGQRCGRLDQAGQRPVGFQAGGHRPAEGRHGTGQGGQ